MCEYLPSTASRYSVVSHTATSSISGCVLMMAQCESPILPNPNRATRIIVETSCEKCDVMTKPAPGLSHLRGPGPGGMKKTGEEQSSQKGLHDIDEMPPGASGA